MAAVTHSFTGTSFGPQGTVGGSTFGSVQGVAVDQVSGDVYVFDGAAGKIYKFDEDGEPANFSSLASNVIEGAGGGSNDENPAAEREIAVAPAGAPGGTAGDIYVANGAHSFKVYSPAGQELPEVGTGGETCGVATDPAGHVYAGIYPSTISEYTPSANPPIATDKTAENTGVNVGLCNVAADGSGNVYAANYGEGIYKLEGLADSTPTKLDATANSIGIDPSNGDVYADRRGEVAQYSASGALLGTFGADLITRSRGVAVSVTAEKVYAGSSTTVKIFGPTVQAATVQTGEATNLTSSSARLNGTVNPEGVALTECKFEYKAAGEPFTSAPCAESPGEIGAGNTPVAVHADLSGLIGSTTYSFRLVVRNEKNAVTQGEIKAFKTLGPAVSGLSVLAISDHGAIFAAQVNPNTQETSYVFQYVSEDEFQASGFANAKSVPVGGEAVGAGSEPVEVKQAVSDLSLETSYRVRVVASNDGGVTTSAARAFRTYGTYVPGLGDGRAYEQVSSPDKHGQDIRANALSVQAAEDGNRITFYSSMALPESESAQEFPSALATRSSTPAAWSTQGILPSVASGQYGRVRGWSEDLSATFAANKENVAGGKWSFYLRESGGNLVTIAGGIANLEVFFAAASQGSGEAYFESRNQLLPEAAAEKPNAYIWDRSTGELKLAGVLNDGTPASPAGTIAGPYAWLQENTMAGGRERGYYTQPVHALSRDGSVAFFTSAEAGQLYARLNPSAEQSPLNGSEECTDPQLACTLEVSASQRTTPDPNGEKPAAFLSATPDGSKVFFMSSGKLTDNATTGPSDEGNDLYSYDTQSGELVDLTPDAADPNGAEVRGLLGSSEDGSYAYFTANGVLAAGASAGDCREVNFNFRGTCNLYLWHEGTITFITNLQAGGEGGETSDVWNWIPTVEVPDGRPKSARVSSDGKTLLLLSAGKQTSYENEGRAELYRYRVGTPGLACLSCVPTGAPPSAPLGDGTRLASAERVTGPQNGGTPAFTRNLSADGNRAFFETLDKLIPADTNGDAGCPILNPRKFGPETRACRDVYEWEAKGTGTCESESQDGGCLYLVSAGTREEPSYFLDASTSGNDAFILTRDRLVGQDEDDLEDVYDARVGGGIASQNPEKIPPCEGEACKGAATTPPGSPSAGSAVFVGPGNQKSQAKKHKKHKKKRHGRNHKKKHQKQASKSQARAHR
jgi:hypothetical protein